MEEGNAPFCENGKINLKGGELTKKIWGEFSAALRNSLEWSEVGVQKKSDRILSEISLDRFTPIFNKILLAQVPKDAELWKKSVEIVPM